MFNVCTLKTMKAKWRRVVALDLRVGLCTNQTCLYKMLCGLDLVEKQFYTCPDWPHLKEKGEVGCHMGRKPISYICGTTVTIFRQCIQKTFVVLYIVDHLKSDRNSCLESDKIELARQVQTVAPSSLRHSWPMVAGNADKCKIVGQSPRLICHRENVFDRGCF